MATTGRRPRACCPFPLPRALVAVAALVALPAVGVEVQSARVVSNAGADKWYAMGDTIEVAVTFDGNVWVKHGTTGGLTFTLGIASGARSMRFVDGDGSRRLRFQYRVQEGDLDEDGISFGRDAIAGGTLADREDTMVDDTLPEDLKGLEDDKDHRVDAVAPEATGVVIVSEPGDDDIYAAGDHIDLRVSFDGIVKVSGAPVLLISVGDLSRAARLLDTRPTQLTFRYVVQRGDLDEDGVSVQAGALQGGTIVDEAGNPAVRERTVLDPDTGHTVDTIAPAVEGVEITSNAGPDDTYAAGDAIEVLVVFGEIVHVTTPFENDPLVLELSIGELIRDADFVGGSGTRSLRFRYVVQAGDLDDDGISLGPRAIQGGLIQDPGGTEADRAMPSVLAQAAHKVDAGGLEPPLVTEVEIVSGPQAGSTYGTGEAITVEVTFDKEVHVTGDPVLTISVGAPLARGRFRHGQRHTPPHVPLQPSRRATWTRTASASRRTR